MKDEQQVIVVGAGPVGLWLAGELALAGVPTLVLERYEQRSPHSKALGLHVRTIEVFAMRGMAERFLAEGARIPNWHFGMLDSRLDFGPLDTPYPFLLRFPQVRTEELLERRALELGVEIRRGHAVTGLSQDTSSVTVDVDGGTSTYSAAFAVGADGAGSTVRKAAGIGFPGTDANAYGYIGEVHLDNPPPLPASWHNTEGELTVVPMDGGLFRIMGYDPAHQRAEDDLTFETLRETAFRIAGDDFGMHDPTWLTRFGNATRLAETYRHGRVLLAGDAAHMNFPAGGVGLNVGLQDAMNLGWKLAAEVQGRAAPGLLDTYHSERHPVGAALGVNTLAQSALITAFTPDGLALRTLLSQLIGAQPQLSRVLAERLTALDVAYPAADPAAHPLTGARVPDPEVFELLRAGRPVLLAMPGAEVAVSGVDVHPSSLAEKGGPAWAGVGAALIRPDGHVWWAGDASAAPAALAGLVSVAAG